MVQRNITTTKLSIIIPVFNEEEMIDLIFEKLVAVIDENEYDAEIIFVDDGSRDGTRDRLIALHLSDPRVKFLALSRNHGHQLALTAGMDFCTGGVAITMDGDLQHPPELIPKMIEAWEDGAEVVQMIKQTQKGRGLIKSLAATLFYRLFSVIAEIDLDANASDFRLLGSRALRTMRKMRERERFLRGLTSWIGFDQRKISYVAPERARGSAKYTFAKLQRLALSGIFSFSIMPMTIGAYVGALLALLAFLYGFYWVIAKATGAPIPPGQTDIMVAVTGLAGVQLLFLGVIGTYVGKVFQEVKRRPLFIIEEAMGFDDEVA